MTYLAVNPDGSTTTLSVITGYRVLYREKNGRRRSKPFSKLYDAIGFQRSLLMGQASRIVPTYSQRPTS